MRNELPRSNEVAPDDISAKPSAHHRKSVAGFVENRRVILALLILSEGDGTC